MFQNSISKIGPALADAEYNILLDAKSLHFLFLAFSVPINAREGMGCGFKEDSVHFPRMDVWGTVFENCLNFNVKVRRFFLHFVKLREQPLLYRNHRVYRLGDSKCRPKRWRRHNQETTDRRGVLEVTETLISTFPLR